MKRITCLLICLIIISGVYAEDDSIYNSDELLLSHKISGMVYLDVPRESQLSWLTARLTFLPQNDSRQVTQGLTLYPKPYFLDGSTTVFRWDEPSDGTLTFEIDSLIKTRNAFIPVTKKVDYPLDIHDITLEQYLQETELIDINPAIKSRAQSLAQNKDDVYDVAFTVADWITKNIEYDLNSITADASQKASWVYEKRQGVCDELSTLFISMMRSLGIPARFVSGISYTNSELFTQSWNAHAWAEIYVPEFGWIPFDLTYKQFGYIDASHIKLKVSNDADESTTQYNWEGYNINAIDITPTQLDFQTQIVSSKSTKEKYVDATMSVIKDKIGFGSYSALKIVLENTKEHYVTSHLTLVSAPEVTFGTEPAMVLLFKPYEKKTIYVPFKLTSDLASTSRYTVPIALSDYHALLSETAFESERSYQKYSESEIEALIQSEENTNKFVELPVAITCASKTTPVQPDVPFTFACDLQSTVPKKIDVTICMFARCQDLPIDPFDIQTVQTTHTYNVSGEKQALVTVTASSQTKRFLFDIPVKDSALITIGKISVPSKVYFGESYPLSIELKKDSVSTPKRVMVKLQNAGLPYFWNVGTLNTDQMLSVDLAANSLNEGNNTMTVVATYFDEFGQNQTLAKSFSVVLADVTFWQSIKLWFFHLLT
ncbi:MAG TPA: transglutaminase domain-containing protein [Acidobacteriota bacterium]|nr:transglutaminase domain-containing protein [Acidobacteriota bacterium]